MRHVKSIGKRNRQRGHSFEREVCNLFKAHGFSQTVTARAESRTTDNKKVDLCFTAPFNVQCKATNRQINVLKALEEMPKEPTDPLSVNYNIIFNKITNKKTLVYMDQSDFLELLDMLVVNNIIKPQ